jgi:hypothetical protein
VNPRIEIVPRFAWGGGPALRQYRDTSWSELRHFSGIAESTSRSNYPLDEP